MKQIGALGVALLLLLFLSVPTFAKAKGMVLIDGKNGRVLFEENKDERLPMASTTKIMTALLALEEQNLDFPFVVDKNAIRVEGSSMGLSEGDAVTLRALVKGMLLSSGNDAANAAAVRIAGTLSAFVKKMNERAALLGMSNTRFQTPSGLDAEGHYSSAYDMAILAKEALKNPDFAKICAKSKESVVFGAPPRKQWLSNHNRLLKELPGATGVKTGFTKKAGRCLVSSAERDGVALIGVTLGCPDDWETHTALYERFFQELSAVDMEKKVPAVVLPVTGGVTKGVSLAAEPVKASLRREEEKKIKVVLSTEPFLFAPVEKGQTVGKARFYLEDVLIAETVLKTKYPVPEKSEDRTWIQKQKDQWMPRSNQ